MKQILIVVFSLCLFVSFSCGSSAPENKTDKLISVQWYLTSLNGKSVDKIALNFEIPYLNFSKENGFTGFTGCNNFAGNYKYENDKLTLDAGSITKKYCGDSMEIELLDAFKKVSAFETKDNILVLLTGSQEVMKFIPKK